MSDRVFKVIRDIPEHLCICKCCQGSGVRDGLTCGSCEGSGRVWVSSHIETTVRPYDG